MGKPGEGSLCPGLDASERSHSRFPVQNSQVLVDMENEFAAHTYHPIPVVFSRAKGAKVWDPENREYLDFLSAYSALNQGHCHPRLIDVMINQAKTLTLSSRAFYNDQFGSYAKFITKLFKYDMVLPMNTGAEGVETAMKLARKWGYLKKGIPENRAIILACQGNFHGRTIGVISMSSESSATRHFGPYLPNVGYKTGDCSIAYDNIEDLERVLNNFGGEVAAFLVEPIQGEAGVIVPTDGYLRACHELCRKHNVLFMADEIQTGLGRTGKMLAVEHENVRPDVLILGKALGGGIYPVSAVLADKEIMLCIQPGEHGSTFGGNPLASAIAKEALQIILDEKLAERAEYLGEIFRRKVCEINSPLIAEVRGRGLLNAIQLDERKMHGATAWQFCLLLKSKGVLAKQTHHNVVRFSPPLSIEEADLLRGISIIEDCLCELAKGATSESGPPSLME